LSSKSQTIVLNLPEVSNRLIVHRFNPVAVFDQGKQIRKQLHYPDYKTYNSHFGFGTSAALLLLRITISPLSMYL